MRPKKFNERGLKTLIFGDFWAPLLFSSPFFDPVYRHGGPPLFSGGPAQMTFPTLCTPWFHPPRKTLYSSDLTRYRPAIFSHH